jgi:hypothetical protein
MWRSKRILDQIYMPTPLNTAKHATPHASTIPPIQQKECIGRESNPGLAETERMNAVATANFTTKPPMRKVIVEELDDLTRGRTWNLLIADWIVVKRLAIGPLGQLLQLMKVTDLEKTILAVDFVPQLQLVLE